MLRKITPMKAMRMKCLDCCCGSALEVRLCPIKTCPLHAYRFGKRPKKEPLYDTTDQSIKIDEKSKKS